MALSFGGVSVDHGSLGKLFGANAACNFTDPFTILEPRDQEHSEFYVV